LKVLWWTNILMPDAARQTGRSVSGGSGGWMRNLLERLKLVPDLKLGVISEGGRKDCEFTVEGVDYFVVKTPLSRGIRNRLRSSKDVQPIPSQIREFASLVERWDPDMIHVHGVESSFGLVKAWGLTKKPLAVSIQGLMAPCAVNAYGGLHPRQVHGKLVAGLGINTRCLHRWKGFQRRSATEAEIIRAADIVMGRTEWDHAWAEHYNPSVRYRHVDELMRTEFLEAAPWRVESCVRRQIFCTSAGEPAKGLHVLLQAVAGLRKSMPDIALRIASGGFTPPLDDYARYVIRLIKDLDLEAAVSFLGVLDAQKLVQEIQAANCFVTPSFIENGCNAVQEAMLVGAPCVATLTGGLLTTIRPEETGLGFPVGDSALLGRQIARILADDALASRIGAEARKTARTRHDPATIERQVLDVYRELTGLGENLRAQAQKGHSIGG